MKHFATLLFVTFAGVTAFCQTGDTTFLSVAQDTGQFEKQRFINRYDYVFGTQKPTRLLFKWNVLAAMLPFNENENNRISTPYDDANSDISRLELSAEYKINKFLSVHTTGSAGFLEGDFIKGKQRRTEWRVEPRLYYDMPARIRHGKSANNLSGNYIGLEYGRVQQSRRDGPDPGNWFSSNTYSLRFGLQRRLFRFGYVDINAGAGFRNTTYSGNPHFRDNPFFFNTRVALGLAIGAPKYRQGEGSSYCDVLRCFQEDRQMFKIDLLRAVQLRSDMMRFSPSFAYERKIGESSFSVELEGALTAIGWDVFITDEGRKLVWEYGMSVSAEPRWYFLQKSRIARGKSGNNLSGIYGAVNARYHWNYSAFILTPSRDRWISAAQLSPIVGFQYRLFRNGFINYKFGVAWDELDFSRFEFTEPSHWFSELKIGLAF
ncbi:MAG: hypothetical protein IPJ82_04995 [Lewinellaceae bacterium]|nr:hypothetical protein [Lewinellaceae bacterium]